MNLRVKFSEMKTNLKETRKDAHLTSTYFGLAIGAACKAIKVPAIIGMMLTGIVLGPQALNLLDPKILSISPDLWKMALVIIIINAGLSIKVSDLKVASAPAWLHSGSF